MFTGIVEELGEVATVERFGDSARLTVRGPLVASDAGHGESIAVNGVCLTIAETQDGTFSADVMQETLDRSSLGELRPGSPVNLERAMRFDARVGGHLVQGHVDATARILERTSSQHWDLLRLSLPPDLARYVVHKGSITVDGVSLTVAELAEDSFTVSLIPTTLALTTLGRKHPGDAVNIEVDVVAKYVERLMTSQREGGPR